jgi:hypothetical protein
VRLAADAHADVERGSEHAVAAPVHFDDGLRLEDGLSFAKELGLVAGRQDQARDDGDTDGHPAGIEDAQLGQEGQVANALVVGLEMDVVVGAIGVGPGRRDAHWPRRDRTGLPRRW